MDYYNELYHYGIKGQKWGVRRYQNADGSLTEAGQKRVYKTVKRYDVKGNKNARIRLGQAVGEDKMITEAARKVVPMAKKYGETLERLSRAEDKLRKAYDDERDRLYMKEKSSGKKWDGMDHKQIFDNAQKNVDKTKVRKEFDEAYKQSENAYKEYQTTTRKVAEEYLGKYGDKKLRELNNGKIMTAKEALAVQINWGIGLDRVKDTD